MLRFGAFELDEVRGELRRNGVRIRLQHQPRPLDGDQAGRAERHPVTADGFR